MDNQKLKGLIVGWRNISHGLINKRQHFELSNSSKRQFVADILNQCANELEALIFIDEEKEKFIHY